MADKPFIQPPGESTPYTQEPESGAGLIAAERLRQIKEEGYNGAHDDALTSGDLARAAACYAAPSYITAYNRDGGRADYWPFDAEFDRRNSEFRINGRNWSLEIRIRELTKAGALCAAEIDRLKRLEKSQDADA